MGVIEIRHYSIKVISARPVLTCAQSYEDTSARPKTRHSRDGGLIRFGSNTIFYSWGKYPCRLHQMLCFYNYDLSHLKADSVELFKVFQLSPSYLLYFSVMC